MDDDTHESGLGGLAWYQLGRMSAESDRVRSDAIDTVLSRRRVVSHEQILIAENQALTNENAQLRRELAAYQYNYNKLRAWAEEAFRDLKQLRG